MACPLRLCTSLTRFSYSYSRFYYLSLLIDRRNPFFTGIMLLILVFRLYLLCNAVKLIMIFLLLHFLLFLLIHIISPRKQYALMTKALCEMYKNSISAHAIQERKVAYE